MCYQLGAQQLENDVFGEMSGMQSLAGAQRAGEHVSSVKKLLSQMIREFVD